jgi:hypothetical protein
MPLMTYGNYLYSENILTNVIHCKNIGITCTLLSERIHMWKCQGIIS